MSERYLSSDQLLDLRPASLDLGVARLTGGVDDLLLVARYALPVLDRSIREARYVSFLTDTLEEGTELRIAGGAFKVWLAQDGHVLDAPDLGRTNALYIVDNAESPEVARPAINAAIEASLGTTVTSQ